MKTCRLFLFWILLALTARTETWVPFHLPWESPQGSPADANFLLDAPAGKRGFVRVRDGHFYFQRGDRVRFWAVNLSGEASFPDRDVAPRVADRLARFGFNLVRLHGLDGHWGDTLFLKNAPDTQHFDAQQLDKLDTLIAELERRGIYINLNLHVARKFMPADNVPQSEWLGYAKYCVIFDPRMIELQKDYARQLFTHRNPHTGRAYADDPAVVITELTNEDSLFGGWTRGFLRGKQTKRGSTWSDIPPFYGEELTRFYNEWIATRYPTREALAAAWREGSRPAGTQLLRNSDFASGSESWELSKSKPANAKLEAVQSAAKVTVAAVDGTAWHVMLTQRSLTLKRGQKYRVAFRARADAPRRLPVEVCHSEPYAGYGSARFEIGTEWQELQFTFTAPSDDTTTRLSFQFGDATGTTEIANVVLQEAPMFGLRDDEDPKRGTVRRLDPNEFASHTDDRFRDEGRFYFELERRYYATMAKFLRDELHVRALIEGTNENYGLPSLRAQATLDLMDCHAYWQHPSFPVDKPWSRTDWTIGNTPMLDAPDRCSISLLSRSAVAGKPMTVSEYNHPFPSEYGCEMPLLLAAYASLQDWDAIYGYTFGHRWDEKTLGGDQVTGYFDLCNEVSKMAQMPTASLLFQRGLVAPAHRLVRVSYDERRTFDALKEQHWGRPQFFLDGEPSPFLPLVHRFRVERFDASKTTRADSISFKDPDGRIASDTGELVWEATEKRTGRLTINTPQLQAAVGWLGGNKVGQVFNLSDHETNRLKTCSTFTADVDFRLDTPFAAVSLAALDGQPLARSKKILLVAAARCANTGMQWNEKRSSINDKWGGPPLLIEPVEGELTLHRDLRAPPLQLIPLDGRGLPQAKRALTPAKDGERMRLPLQSAQQTVWYVLQPK